MNSVLEKPELKGMQLEDIQNQRDYIRYCQSVHSYSPAVIRLMDQYLSYVSDVEEAYRRGEKNVIIAPGIYPSAWEPPFLYALDVVPLSHGEMGRLSDWKDMQIAEDAYQFPPESCSMVKCVVGQLHKRKDDSGCVKRVLGSCSGCEPFNQAWETMRQEGYEIHHVDVIYRAHGVNGERLENLADFFIEQLHETAEWVTGSREIDENKLRREMQRKNRLLEKMRRILELRLSHPFYIRSLPTILILNIGLANYFGKPEEYEDAIDSLLTELENAYVDEEEIKRTIPLFWSGSTAQEFGIFEAIDQAGGALLGFRSAPNKLFREDVPPLEAIVHYVYSNQRAGAESYMREFIDREVTRIKARGLVLYSYIGCSYASVEKEMQRNYFHQKDLPSINLEGSFQVGAPNGQLLTRIRAFIEMLS
jgi:benzoyl-CoA reductase/2-hydroxyglutaryl-CoA dehydratase subunit BcrC/BadD/HgdB